MEIDLRELFGAIKQRIVWILLAALVGGLAGTLGTYFFVTPMYTATTSLYVSNNQRTDMAAITSGDLTAAQGLVDTYIVILESDTVLRKVVDTLSLPYTTEQLRKEVSAASINKTEAFRVSVTDKDPAMAQTIANAIATVAPDEIVRVSKAGAVEIIDQATLPQKPNWPIGRNGAIGVLLGLVLSVLCVAAYKILDTTVRGEEDLTKRYELPVLGTIPGIHPVMGYENSAEKDAQQ